MDYMNNSFVDESNQINKNYNNQISKNNKGRILLEKIGFKQGKIDFRNL